MSTFEELLGGEEAIEFGPPKTGSYEEPDRPNLPLVNEKMELTICVSPEAGWGELEAFLGETRSVDGRDVSVHGAAYFRGREGSRDASGTQNSSWSCIQSRKSRRNQASRPMISTRRRKSSLRSQEA